MLREYSKAAGGRPWQYVNRECCQRRHKNTLLCYHQIYYRAGMLSGIPIPTRWTDEEDGS